MPQTLIQPKPELDIPALIAHFPLFEGLPKTDIARIARQTFRRHVWRGEIIFQCGDVPDGFFYLVRGHVKVGCMSPEGAEKIVELIGPMESFGKVFMFQERPYPVFAQALEDCVLLHVRAAAVFEQIERDPQFARTLLRRIARWAHHLVCDVEAYALQSSTQRVIGYLLRQARDHAQGAIKEWAVELTTSKQAIASRLNLTPETLSRILHHLSTAGLIEVRGRSITLLAIDRLEQQVLRADARISQQGQACCNAE